MGRRQRRTHVSRSGAAAAALLLLAFLPARAYAHGDAPAGPWDVWYHWNTTPLLVGGLVLTAALYGVGLRRLWRRSGPGRVISRGRAAAFAGALLVLAVALVSPLDPLGEVLFAAHMIQHLLLVLVAAPLLVAGAPEVATLWALPPRARARAGRAWREVVRSIGAGDGRSGAGIALASVAVATATLWAWHVPALYDLAVQRESVHALEHMSFLVTALVFWASVLRLRPRDHLGNGLRLVYLFFMAVQGSILGALITFAAWPLYESHADIPAAWGVAPLADQQLAGLIMWVPPALLYIGIAAYLFARWLDVIGRRTGERERLAARTAERLAG